MSLKKGSSDIEPFLKNVLMPLAYCELIYWLLKYSIVCTFWECCTETRKKVTFLAFKWCLLSQMKSKQYFIQCYSIIHVIEIDNPFGANVIQCICSGNGTTISRLEWPVFDLFIPLTHPSNYRTTLYCTIRVNHNKLVVFCQPKSEYSK